MLNNFIGYFILIKLKLQFNRILQTCKLFMLLRVIKCTTIVSNCYESPNFFSYTDKFIDKDK